MKTQLIVFLGILVGGVVAATTFAVYGGRRRRASLQQIETAILVDGQPAAIFGTVRAGETIVAPISGKKCVAYRVRIQRRHGDDARGKLGLRGLIDLETLETDIRVVATTSPEGAEELLTFKSIPFEVETAGKLVRVEGTAGVGIAVAPVIPRKLEREIAFARELGFDGDRMRNLSFEEGCIEIGAKVLVHGMVEIEGGTVYLRAHPTCKLEIGRLR